MADSRRTDTPLSDEREPIAWVQNSAGEWNEATDADLRIRRSDTPEAVAVERAEKYRAEAHLLTNERDRAVAALDCALTVLRELADFAGEATDNAYCSVIAQHARDVLAELDPGLGR